MEMVEYHDFFFVLIPAFALQITALVYLFKIRKIIGQRNSRLYGASNTLMLMYDIVIAYLIALAIARPMTQPIEIGGIFLAYIFPNAMAFTNIMKQRGLYKAVTPNSVGKKRLFRWWF